MLLFMSNHTPVTIICTGLHRSAYVHTHVYMHTNARLEGLTSARQMSTRMWIVLRAWLPVTGSCRHSSLYAGTLVAVYMYMSPLACPLRTHVYAHVFGHARSHVDTHMHTHLLV